MSLFRTKPITATNSHHPDGPLKRCLTAFDLVLLGIGGIIGAGVFVLTGVAAATQAGPAIMLSYILSGVACLFAALAYAELSSSVGGCGSAYGYAYASFGELVAWIMGWALLVEYAVSVSGVAIGWSGYVNNILNVLHISIPPMLTKGPLEGGWINLPAAGVVVVLAGLLCLGVKESTRFNSIVVFVKLITVAVFIAVACGNVDTTNWHPFAPFGWSGVAGGAAIVFYAYIGFDAVSTAAEETINPQRNLPIGLIGSLVGCTLIYVIVSALLTGIANYTTLNVSAPVADAITAIGYPIFSGIIAAGAIAGLTTVMLVMFYGLTRILLAISRDGMLPPLLGKINRRTHTPIPSILLSGIVMAAIAGFVPLGEAAALVNIGALTAFVLVCGGVMVLRYTHPDLPRSFKLPLNPLIPILGIIFCIYLMTNLSTATWWRFGVWLAIGLVIYFSYSRKRSVLNQKN